MPPKAEGAFRTIREVADWLGVPTHVLRFWESKFTQIAPVKGAGGRRYYRPDDMRLLGGIKVMLHDKGLTIRGVTRVIDEEGLDPVLALSPPLEVEAASRTRRVIRSGDEVPSPAKPAPGQSISVTPQGGREEVPVTERDEPSPEAVPPEPLPDGTPESPTPRPEPLPDGSPETPAPARQPADPGTGPNVAPGPFSDPQHAPADRPDLLPEQPEDVAADTIDHDGAPEVTTVEDAAPAGIAPGRRLPAIAARDLLNRSVPRPGSRPALRRLRRRASALADGIREDLEFGAAR